MEVPLITHNKILVFLSIFTDKSIFKDNCNSQCASYLIALIGLDDGTAIAQINALLANLIVSDIKEKVYLSQYGNQKGTSIQHCLINMTQQILTDTEGKKVTAVLATMLDWKDAFPMQCLKLGFLFYFRIWSKKLNDTRAH